MLFLLGLLLGSPGEAEVRQVVILQSSERGNLILDRFTAMLRAELSERYADSLSLTEFVVNPARFSDSPDEAMVEYLRASFAGQPKPDLIITTGGSAAAFFGRHRERLFPDSPVLFASVDERWSRGVIGRGAKVAVSLDPMANVSEMVRLLPETENVFVVVGGGTLGRFWREVLEQESGRLHARLRFIWPDGLSYAEMLRQAASLPPRSIIFFTSTYEVDGEGATYSTERVLADLHARANSPVFGMLSVEFGHGAIGGRLIDVDALGRTTVDVAIRILEGQPAELIETPARRSGTPVFDWRELERWGIDEGRLPEGSRILFREPTAWERYKWPIVGGVAALAAQSLLIAGLLVNRVRRRRAERSLRESEGRFRVLADSAPVMIRMSDEAAQATDFNVPWLSFTGRDIAGQRGNGWLEGVHPADLSTVVDARRTAMERREGFRMEYRLRRADGEYRWVLDSGQPRIAPDGDFAGFIGSAIDITDLKAARATLASLNRRLMEAQEQERSRLARELHDDVCQRMTIFAMDLERLRASIPESEAEARQQARDLYESVGSLAKHVSSISHRLHSSKLELFGLASAAATFCKETSSHYGIDVDFVHAGVAPKLPPDVAINVFRVLQEALTNAARHSGAASCRVSLRQADDELRLEVRDDGSGFDTGAALATSGLGLVSMQERLKLVEGSVTIESAPGAGTAIRATVPLGPTRVESPGAMAQIHEA